MPLPLEGEEGSPSPTGRNRRKWWIIGAAAVVLAGGGTGLGLWLTGSSTPVGLVVKNETVAVTTGTIKQTVATSGTVAAGHPGQAEFRRFGDSDGRQCEGRAEVTSGQVLATVDTTALQAEVDAAQAQVDSAEARLSSDEYAQGRHHADRLGRGLGHLGRIVALYGPRPR